MIKYFAALALLSIGFGTTIQNEDSPWFVNNYTKIERQIPMQDGIKLSTSIYLSRDKSEKASLLISIPLIHVCHAELIFCRSGDLS